VKILVTAKRVPDPEQKVKVKDGMVDLSGVSYVINPFDEYAVEAALRLNEKGAAGGKAERFGEVVILSIGPEKAAVKEMRAALAMGADRAVHVVANDDDLDSEIVARIVAKVYEQEQPDLLLMGKQAVDGDSNQAAQLVAGYLGMPQACFASQIETEADAKWLRTYREVDGGIEVKKVPLPAVVTVDLRIVSPDAVRNGQTDPGHKYEDGPRFASLKGIMKAKKKPVDKKTPADLGVELNKRVVYHGYEAPAERAGGIKVKDVAELLDKLHNEAKVI